MSKLLEDKNYSALSDGASALERAFESTVVKTLDRLFPDYHPGFLNPQVTHQDVLPYLAVDRGLLFWDESNTQINRTAIAAQWEQAKKAGTGSGIKNILSAAGIGARVVAWHKEGGLSPYTLRVVVDQESESNVTLSSLKKTLAFYISERDLLLLRRAYIFNARNVIGLGVAIRKKIVIGD